jgi:hypothetical protein
VGLDTYKRLIETDEDGDLENTIGIQVEVLDAILPEHALEEVTGAQRQSTLHELGEHGDKGRPWWHAID